MKLEKVVKILIAVAIVVIIAIVIIILNIAQNEETQEYGTEGIGDEGEVIDYENQSVEKVTDFVNFYTIVNCIDKYIEYLNVNNTAYYGYDENNEYSLLVSDEEINEYIYDLLSEDYIEENSITIDNLRNSIEVFDKDIIFTPLKMNVYVQDTVEKYVVYGFLVDSNMDFIQEMYMGVNLDVTNNTFSIEPISDDSITDIDEIEIINTNEEIIENNFNSVDTVMINNEYICGQYLQTYKKLILAMPELAYEYLDEEYRKSRFGSYESFIEYRTENYDNLYTLTLAEYEIDTYDEYKEYVCIDNNNNTYIFTEIDGIIMNFNAKLDIYTIETDTFVESYNALTDSQKVQTNINIFFQMINTKDYVSAYEVLNDSFKENYFSTKDEFEEYAQNNFFESTTITTVNELTQSGSYYVCTIVTSNGDSAEGETSEETFIVSLGDGTDFEMSFTVKE